MATGAKTTTTLMLPRTWFGLRPPGVALAAWGARAIDDHGRFDLIWNRQQCDPGCRGDDGAAARHRDKQRRLANELVAAPKAADVG